MYPRHLTSEDISRTHDVQILGEIERSAAKMSALVRR